MKRKPRRVKEQGSFLKRQLKGLERSGAFKQPWEGGVLAGVQAAVPSGHSFLLNAAAPGPLLLLFQAAVKSFPTPASEPGELCSVSSHAACLPPALGCARRFDQSCLHREPPDPHASYARDVGASSPSRGWHCQKSPPWLMETPVCHHLPARGRQLLQQIGSRDAGRRRARCPVMGSCPPKWERANVPCGGCEVGQHVWKGPARVPTPGIAMWHPRGPVLRYAGGVRDTSSNVAGVPSKSNGAGVLQAEAGAALWHTFPPQTPPHLLPWMPSSKKHRSERNLAVSARRAHLSEWGASHSVLESTVPGLRGEIQSAG